MTALLGAMVLFVVVLVGLIFLVHRMITTRRLTVNEAVRLPGSAGDADRAVIELLGSIRGAQLLVGPPGRHVLVLRRCPSWVAIPVVFFFPFGLLFLVVREDVRLDVNVYADGDQTAVWLTGQSELHILEHLRRSLALLPVS